MGHGDSYLRNLNITLQIAQIYVGVGLGEKGFSDSHQA